MMPKVKDSDLPSKTQAELIISLIVAVTDRTGRSEDIDPQNTRANTALLTSKSIHLKRSKHNANVPVHGNEQCDQIGGIH